MGRPRIMKKRKIAVLASSRATYGYKRKIIGMINRSRISELQLIVTGMHLLKHPDEITPQILRNVIPSHSLREEPGNGEQIIDDFLFLSLPSSSARRISA